MNMTKKKLPKAPDTLDLRQQRFCEEYIIDWNGTRAAKVAGYSEKTASEQASRLLTNVKIKEYIEKCKNNIEELAGLSKLMALKQIKEIAINDDEESTTKLKAFQDLSKMLGWNDADKLDHTSKGDRINLTPMQFVKTNAKD